MKRIPEDMCKLFDGSTPERCAFSMQLAAEMQLALDRWVEKNSNLDADFVRRHVRIKRDRLTLDPEGDWRDTVIYNYNPIFSVTWNVKNGSIIVEDYS